MAWTDWISAAGMILGGLAANKDSKNALKPREVWGLSSPSINSPFYNSVSNWNNGNPSQTITLSPELQQLYEGLLGNLGAGRMPRQMNPGMRDLYGATQGYQMSRYGLNPNYNTYSSYYPWNPGGGSSTGTPENPVQGSGFWNFEGDVSFDDTYDAGNGDQYQTNNWLDEIGWNIRNRDMQNSDGAGVSWDQLFSKYYDTWNRSQYDDAFRELGYVVEGVYPKDHPLYGENQYRDIGSLDQLEQLERMGWYGELLSLLSGIPGLGKLGELWGDKVIGSKTWMNPIDPNDPYGIYGNPNDDAADQIRRQFEDGDLPRSGMYDGNTAESMPWLWSDQGFFDQMGWGILASLMTNNGYTPTVANNFGQNSPYHVNPDQRGSFGGGSRFGTTSYDQNSVGQPIRNPRDNSSQWIRDTYGRSYGSMYGGGNPWGTLKTGGGSPWATLIR